MFPSDHVIENEKRFREDIKHAAEIAGKGPNIVVIGIPPTRAETGYGYIEAGASRRRECCGFAASLRSLRLKLQSNSCWLAIFSGTAECLSGVRVPLLTRSASICRGPRLCWREIAASYGTRSFEKTFARLYPKCENISIDYAVLEPRSAKGEGKSGIYCIPAGFGWNDLGSWTALYEHRSSGKDGENVIQAGQSFTLNAEGNFIHSRRKFVAAVGVKNLVVVETDDALLITTREHSQDVGKVVKHLDEKKLKHLV